MFLKCWAKNHPNLQGVVDHVALSYPSINNARDDQRAEKKSLDVLTDDDDDDFASTLRSALQRVSLSGHDSGIK